MMTTSVLDATEASLRLERGHCPVCASRYENYVSSAIMVTEASDGALIYECSRCRRFVHRLLLGR